MSSDFTNWLTKTSENVETHTSELLRLANAKIKNRDFRLLKKEAVITELKKELESANQKIAELKKPSSSFNYCDGYFRPINKNTEE